MRERVVGSTSIVFIHLDFLLELPPASRKSLSRSLLVERNFRLSRLFDLGLCLRLDLSRSFALLRRTGDKDLLRLLERPILCENFWKENVCLYYAFPLDIRQNSQELQSIAIEYTTTHIEAP